MAELASRIVNGERPRDLHLVQYLRIAAFAGEPVPTEALLYLTTVLAGGADRRRRPAKPAAQKVSEAVRVIGRLKGLSRQEALQAIAEERRIGTNSAARFLARARAKARG